MIFAVAWWFSSAAVESDRGSSSQSRWRSDKSVAGARSLGWGPARMPDCRNSQWQNRHLPVCQEHHGPTSHQRPRGAEVDLFSLLTSSPFYQRLCSGLWLKTVCLNQNMADRPAKGSVCTGVYICGPQHCSCCWRPGKHPPVTLLYRALRREQVQTYTYFQDRLQVREFLTAVKTNFGPNYVTTLTRWGFSLP